MNTDQMLAEIREVNLSYMLLARNMIRENRDEAMYRLGITEELADLIGALSMAQVVRIAASNMLMCRFRFDDPIVWELITDHGSKQARDPGMNKIHAAIAMANMPLVGA